MRWLILALLLSGCATINGVAHGWSLAEAPCYPNGTVDCDDAPARACSCN